MVGGCLNVLDPVRSFEFFHQSIKELGSSVACDFRWHSVSGDDVGVYGDGPRVNAHANDHAAGVDLG